MPQSPFDKLRVSGSEVQLVKFSVRAESFDQLRTGSVEARKTLFIA
jgi:hypothetical protein